MKRGVFLSVLLISVVVFFFSRAEEMSMEKNDMNSIIEALKKDNIEYHLFSNEQGNQFLVVPKFGGRILAAFVDGENVFWTHPDVPKGQGGQRTWISPEGGEKGFIFKPDWTGNREFSMMDPGNYEVVTSVENEHLILENRFATSSNDQKEKYDLTVTREMRHLEDPLQGVPEFEFLKYSFLGIDFIHKLKNNSDVLFDKILALWCLIQVTPKGTMIVPVQDVEGTTWRGNYFEPIPKDFVKSNPDSLSFYIHGSQRYKVGIRPEAAKGLICYLAKAKADDFFMVFMMFPVMPEAKYVDRPKTEQGTNGDAIQIYSHLEKGALAFGELECHSWGLELEPDGEKAFPIKIYVYKSSLDVLLKIGQKLICDQFDKAYLFQ